ncbi:MAG: putative acyl-CoA thioester hydrolase [Chlamydiae bacterium]|nr:putative acyl-CoA thioester hydrolase [Chlamydiota bacterium]
MQGKTVSSTSVENHTYKIFPNDLNTNGTLFGGLVMATLDRITLVVAERHSEHLCATISVDALHFLAPAYMGEILICKASLNHAWHTSMEVGAKVLAENPTTKEVRHVTSAYFTFVALNEENRPTKIPPVVPETDLEKRRYEEANWRREERIRASHERKRRFHTQAKK